MNKTYSINLFLLLFLSLQAFSQRNLKDDAPFFYTKLTDYQQWLDSKGFGNVLSIDSLSIEQESVTVFLGYSESENSDFEFSTAWLKLKNEFENKGKISLEEILFKNLFFTFELSPDSIKLFVLSKQAHLFSVEILGNETGIIVLDKIADARDAQKIPIPTIELKSKYILQKDKVKSPDLNKITSEIKVFLQNYYKNKGAWWYFAEVEVVKDFQHDLIIEVKDLKNEILKDERQYFEYIRIMIKAEKQDANVILVYDLMAKYGSGIFLAPRSVSDYKNMETKYPAALENYREKIKSLIHKHLVK